MADRIKAYMCGDTLYLTPAAWADRADSEGLAGWADLVAVRSLRCGRRSSQVAIRLPIP